MVMKANKGLHTRGERIDAQMELRVTRGLLELIAVLALEHGSELCSEPLGGLGGGASRRLGDGMGVLLDQHEELVQRAQARGVRGRRHRVGSGAAKEELANGAARDALRPVAAADGLGHVTGMGGARGARKLGGVVERGDRLFVDAVGGKEPALAGNVGELGLEMSVLREIKAGATANWFAGGGGGALLCQRQG